MNADQMIGPRSTGPLFPLFDNMRRSVQGRIRSAERVEAHLDSTRLCEPSFSPSVRTTGAFDERRPPCRPIPHKLHARCLTAPISAISKIKPKTYSKPDRP